MAQSLTAQHGGEPNPLDTTGLCLLSLDGGGVRGLSSLYILKGLMDRLNHALKKKLKPCEVFDLIGGTSTGGLIAIMLGRLEMTVDECIAAYSKLMQMVFMEKSKLRFNWKGKVKAQFDSKVLRRAIEEVIANSGASATDAFNDGKDRGCRAFVCCVAKETTGITRLRSYTLHDESNIPATICEAALATSAATGFFDPVSIGTRQFVDGALGANNPVEEVEGEAANIWTDGTSELKPLVKCFVSIGTGNPGKKAIEDNIIKLLSGTLVRIATETEETERKFIARWAMQYDAKRYFRFNVDQGLQDVDLSEYKRQGTIEAATEAYLRHQTRKFQVRDCVQNLSEKQKKTEKYFAFTMAEYHTLCILQNQNTVIRTNIIPFLKNRNFVGREDELKKLKQKLMVSRDCQKMSIVGLGGTGKTQVALQFAYTVSEEWPDVLVLWLPALSMESYEQACTDVAKALRIPGAADKEKDSKELVKDWFSTGQPGRWLLVLDNADNADILFGTGDADGIVDYLPASAEGVTLYTTRTQEVAAELTWGNILELGPMIASDATNFLDKSLRSELVRINAGMEELLEALAYLPLAIAQAVAYLNKNRHMTLEKYIKLLQKTDHDLVSLMSKEFRDETRYKGSTNAVATTWIVSFNQIQERDPIAADLLMFISCIEWKAIPRSLLPSTGSETTMEDAIGMLCGYSFLTRRGDGSPKEGEKEWYDMHRLVHLATRIWIDQYGNRVEVEERAVQHVAETFPSDDHSNRAIWRAYLPHAWRMLEEAQVHDFTHKPDLCLSVGQCLLADGRTREAVKRLEECYEYRSELGENHYRRLQAEHELAIAYVDNGQTSEAIELLQHVLKVEETTLEETHPDRLASQYTLSRAYLNNGQTSEAIELLQHVVKVEETTLEETHLDRLASQHVLARAYLDNGQTSEAIELLQHVVKVEETTLEETHPNRLASQHVLARAYLDSGQTSEAIELLQHVVKVAETTLEETHPGRLSSQHVLASAYLYNGQTSEAIELLQHVVEIGSRALRENHPVLVAAVKLLHSINSGAGVDQN